MDELKVVKFIFGLIGAGFLLAAFYAYQDTNSFIAQATQVEGRVVALIRSRDDSSQKPMVQFTTLEGQEIQFVPSVSSSLTDYVAGDTVEVLYLASDPKRAEIRRFLYLWGLTSIFATLGCVCFTIGAGIFFLQWMKVRKDAYLISHGTPISTDFLAVELNTSISVNERNPFQILTQWQNPATSEIHIFKSNPIWFDPSRYINQQKITVFIEQGNPSKYYVDLSFLPKLAK